MKNKITQELAEILGLLCAEGCYSLYYSSFWGKERGKPRFYRNQKSERIEFYNKDVKLLEHYQDLLKKEFNYYPKITKHGKINICKRSIMKTILEQTKLGHLNWTVPQSVLNGNPNIKISFIRGYFDGDGCAVTTIRFLSTNKFGLTQVSCLLSAFNFLHTMPKAQLKPNRKPLYSIQLSRKETQRFLKMVNPISKKPGLRGLPIKRELFGLKSKAWPNAQVQ